MKKTLLFAIFVFCVILSLINNVQAGVIILANDEWTLSNSGFSGLNDAGVFATNIAAEFADNQPGDFLAYSSNFGLTQNLLADAMTNAGHSWTVSTAVTFDLPTLLTYDGVFLAGNAADNNILTDYVNAGGNVYLAGGTGWGGAFAEANRWNPFLNNFGLAFGTFYNGVGGSIPINSPHPIFDGVDYLYQDNGNDTLDLISNGANTEVLVSTSNGHGLYAIYDSNSNVVPEPSSILLLIIGFMSCIGFYRKK